MSTKNVLAALGDTNTLITLGLEVAGEIVPLGKALVRGIRSIGGSTDTTTYELLLVADSTELDAISSLALADLAAINGELAKLGKAPVIPIDSGSSEPPKPPIIIAPGDTGDHGAIGDLGSNTPAVKSS